jgi:hypothetical protein
MGFNIGKKIDEARAAQAAQENAATVHRTLEQNQIRNLYNQAPAYQKQGDTAEAQALKGEAYGTDPLKEYEAMRAQAKAASAQGQNTINQQLGDELSNESIAQGGQQANAYSHLAMNGGLNSGARERIAAGGAQNAMMQAQQSRLANQRALQKNQSDLDQGLLGLTGQEAATRRGLQNSYLQLQGNDVQGQNAYNTARQNQRMDMETGFLKSEDDLAAQKANKG